MGNKYWTNEEIEKLKNLIELNYTKTQISKELNRTVGAVQKKINKLNLAIYNTSDTKGHRGRNWSEEEIILLKELYSDPSISMTIMCNRLQRSVQAIKCKASLLNIHIGTHDTSFLSPSDICKEMGVSYGTVRYWIKIGLPWKKKRAGKVKYLISEEDLLKFLEDHPYLFNASKVSPYLFANEPEWLILKRRKDAKNYPIKRYQEYTNEDDKLIQTMFKSGYSDEEISKIVGRSVDAIVDRRNVLNLHNGKNKWTEHEINTLAKYSKHMPVSELSVMLPSRSVIAIRHMCYKLKISYIYF